MFETQIRRAAWLGVAAVLLLAPGCKRKYDNPITKDTQQPDKVLFDTAIDDIEHGRFERARLTLQTMMNTYDTSEYLAKAKLAVADSWKREGGAHGMAQAEAEYKDFILFYPNMEESAEAQFKICQMQYDQMDKSDRDAVHAQMADAECKDVLQKYPNSQFATQAANYEREVQEVLADKEMIVGLYYAKKGGHGFASSANRLNALVNEYPLYSQADEALWVAADDYNQMGDSFENQQAEMYTRIVRDYPLSIHTNDAKAQLQALGRPVPSPDPVQEARMKFELENRPKRSLGSKITGPFASRPYTANAAKSGNPTMETFKPTIPLDVPETARGGEGVSTITLGTPSRDILDSAPDARNAAGNTTGSSTAAPANGGTADNAATPAAGDKATTAAANGSANGATNGAAAKAAADSSKAAAANAKAAKKGKAPKQPPTPKKRPRPSDQKKKSTAPPAQTAPATDGGANAPASAQTPAKTSGGGNTPLLQQ